MAHEHLATYLNDHVAGSVTLLELLEHLESAYADTAVQSFVKSLRHDVEADRGVLDDLMARLQIPQSTLRKASAWLGEKLAQLKLKLDDTPGGQLRLLEAMEVASLGIEGKHSLWRALRSIADHEPRLRELDYDDLLRRAEDQRRRVETVRLAAAKASLVPTPLM